jgi:glycosyltransferase involved in cell wall biosynthesis
MKVCLLTRYFSTNRKEGVGIGRVSSEILKGLVKRKINIRTIQTNGSGLYSYFFYTAAEVPFRIRNGFDIFHALTPMEGIWLPKDKSIVTYHDLFQITNPDRLGGGMGYNPAKRLIGTKYFELACRVSSRAKRLVCVSEQTKSNVVRFLKVPEDKIRVIKSGIPKVLSPENKKDKTFRIGYLGMLDRRKRVNLLIDAFINSKIDADLVIGGGGLDEGILKERSKLNTRIKFLGSIQEEYLNKFYNSLDLFVFPTWLEGYGLPMVEAMACKKPIIVLHDALIPDEVKNRCIIIDNLEALFKNTNQLLNKIKEVDLESNYKFAKEHDWDKAVDQYIKVYQEIIDNV